MAIWHVSIDQRVPDEILGWSEIVATFKKHYNHPDAAYRQGQDMQRHIVVNCDFAVPAKNDVEAVKVAKYLFYRFAAIAKFEVSQIKCIHIQDEKSYNIANGFSSSDDCVPSGFKKVSTALADFKARSW